MGEQVSILQASPGPLKGNAIVRKKGRTTGLTEGEVNSIRIDIKTPGKSNQICRAWVVKPKKESDSFAKPGDSGALAWDASDDGWCGLIFGGNEENGEGYLIPANVLVADVKLMCGKNLVVDDA